MPDNPTDIWNRIAPWWAEQIGEGNEFQLKLIMPATDRLLEPTAGQRILDVACGNGNYARRLGRLGCRVLAIDAAENFLIDATRRTTTADGAITYQQCDVTNEPALRSLAGPESFDAAVCSMAIMDFATIDPLLRALHRLLKPSGRFVFSISHPCFNSNGSRMTAELINESGRTEQVFGVHITRYLQESTDQAAGILHQPEPHYTYHRSLQSLLGSCFAAGYVVDGFEEPAFPAGTGAKSAFAWAKRPDIPPAALVRLRRV